MLRKTSKIIAESVQLPEHTKKIARKLDTPYITGLDTIQKNGDSNVSLGLKAWDIDWTSANI